MNKFKGYTKDQLEEHFSNFLIDSWSYSKVSCFARNEKEFEKEYVYCSPGKRSASSVAGNAFHAAAQYFFEKLQKGEAVSEVELEREAFSYIERVSPDSWKLQKTTPTVEDCIASATKTAASLVDNFYGQQDLYTDGMSEVLGVELRCEEWLTVNGVDIPLPCHAVIDLVIRTSDGKVVIIDHKGKGQYTDEKDIALVRGKQAITYVLAYESKSGNKVDEVRFVENKYTKNRDNSPQLKSFSLILDEDTRHLYEAMLYEPLRRMIGAVSDPDYVYTVNDADTLSDKAELYEFWTRTMIAEVDDFDIPEDRKPMIAKRMRKIKDSSLAMVSPKAIANFRKSAASFIQYDLSIQDMTNSEKIEHMLRRFGVMAEVSRQIDGYSSDTYLLSVAPGTKIGNIKGFSMDLANALGVSAVRIGKNLVVDEGRSYLAVEVGKKREKDLIWDAEYLEGMKIPVGVDNYGKTVIWDLDDQATPHMLICGATGSGKSVSIASTIAYARLAGVKDIFIMDPKNEFAYMQGEGIHVYSEIADIEGQTKRLVDLMNSRVRTGENSKILVVFDEFADAVSQARSGKDLEIREMVQEGFYANGMPKMRNTVVGKEKSLEENLKILLQKGRSLGFRIIAATQRASTKVITGDAKVNFPVLVCFRVPKAVDSKVVLDEEGAESLQGKGDGLMRSPEYMDLVRFQGFWLGK